MATATAPNYTDEQVSKMVQTYNESENSDVARKATVKAIAKELGKSVKSVIAKLCREQVYVKATPVTKNGTKVTKKIEIVKAIAVTLATPFEALKSLGKATKADLEQLQASLARFEPEVKESDPESE